MPKLTDKQFLKRKKELLEQELGQPESWWYLSFVGAEGFRGACIVKATGITSAIMRCNELEINPHGDVMAVQIPAESKVPPEATNCLLSREDIDKFFEKAVSLEDGLNANSSGTILESSREN